MPQIAASHLLEARAVSRVQSILAESDALSEVVKNDYGEDLIVQTEHLGEADPFQILVQVKGSGAINYSGKPFARRFKVDHLYRWVAQNGSVLICVYDDTTRRVFSFSPKEKFSLWDILSTSNKTLSVTLSKADELTVETARRAIWKARIEHFANLLSISETRHRYTHLHGASKNTRNHHQREIGVICLIFLKMIGMVKGDEFCESVRKIIRNGATYFPNEWEDEKWSLRHLMMFALIGEVNEITGCGVPSNIMEHVTEASGHFYKAFHPDEWNDAQRHMQLAWTPYRGMKPMR